MFVTFLRARDITRANPLPLIRWRLSVSLQSLGVVVFLCLWVGCDLLPPAVLIACAAASAASLYNLVSCVLFRIKRHNSKVCDFSLYFRTSGCKCHVEVKKLWQICLYNLDLSHLLFLLILLSPQCCIYGAFKTPEQSEGSNLWAAALK